ncbi:PPPDE putative peptidase domain containing protein [Amanita muscaria]
MSSSPVKLYVYDLSNGLAKQLSKQLTGKQLDGIWHTSVVVFSKEFLYGQGIIVTPPGQSHFGNPLQILDMEETFIDEDTFNEYIHAMKEHYTADKYHLLEFNCNSFTNDVIGFLTGKSIPSFIGDLPTDFLSTPFGAALRPTIDAMYRRPHPGASRAAAPSPISASSTSTDSQLAASVLQSVAAQASAHPNLANGPGSALNHGTESLSGPVHVITNPASFRSFLNTHKAAVAFFTSSTCGPCRAIEPLFNKLAEDKSMKSRDPTMKGAAFAKVDIGVGLGHNLAAEHRVTATPTFIFFLDGVKIQEIRGANSAELKTQVDLLLFHAYPPHPHTKLSLPLIQKISFNPILFTQIPSADAMTTKLSSFIDSATWPASASSSKAEVKAVISNSIAPYLKTRQTNGTQSVNATTAMLAAWSQATALLVDSIPVEKLFPVVDLWRLFVLDPTTGTWTASLPSFDTHPLTLLLTVAHKQKMACPRNYLLTVLRLSSNVFANPPIAQRLVVGAYKDRLTVLVVQSLLHDDTGVKNASASLIFNLAVVVQSRRMRSMKGEEARGQGTVEMEEDEDWELEIITAVIEALNRETDNEEIVHRLTAALAFIIRLSPFLESLQPLLQVLQFREVLEGKVRENRWRNVEVRKLVEEVAILCDTSGPQ